MKNILKDLKRRDHKRYLGGLDVFKYIGPGLLVTVGFIDPGNWASNFAAGSEFGYSLLWVVTLSTIMLIVLQHNVAHLGIVTGLCLSEAATKYTPKWVSRPILGTAVLASISTSLAEILGGAIALEMLFDIPIIWGAVLTTVFVVIMLFTNSYKKIERSIIAFVSVIGLSFIYELFLVKIDWPMAVEGWVTPAFPKGSMLIIMSVLGAVVMPHNLFLHSEVIQSHEYNKQDDSSIRKVLKYELFDTLFSMIVGWAINSAMILLAAATFFKSGIQVEELQQAKSLLEPLLGNSAAVVFALALLMAGISSTITSGMAAGSIFAGIFGESYHIKDSHSQVGVILSLGIALLLIFFIGDPFKGLLISQMVLSIQLPFTVFLQVGLTSSRKVMGQYVNSKWSSFVLYAIAGIVTVLIIMKQERLNSRFLKVLPMSAEESGNGGRNLNIAYSFTETPFGEILMASTSKGICYLAFVTESRDAVLDELKHIFPHAAYREHRDELQQKTVNAVLSIDKENIDVLPLHLKGTEFQLSVWKELLNIPLGGITSYGKIAQKLQKPNACRAVGSAVGDNPVSVLIPCHRVLRTDGGLGGYHWGLERKVKLLEWEKTLNK
mgnify:CR=1 FL=1